jgi:hypothetical protein
VLAALVLALREAVVRKGLSWLAAGWTRIGLLIATLGLLFWPAAGYLLDWLYGDGVFAVLAFVVALALGAVAYRRWLPDFAATTTVIGFALLFVIAVGYRVIDEAVGFDGGEGLLVASAGLLVLWSVAAMGLAAKLLQLLRRNLEPQPS